MPKKILIAAALKIEIAPFCKHLNAKLVSSNKNLTVYQSTLENICVTIANFGVGNAFNKNLKQFDMQSIDAAFLIGMAGGLKTQQKIGDIAFPENIISVTTKNLSEVKHPSENFLYKLKTIRPAGNILCTNKIINNAEKKALAPDVDFVDMESYHFCNNCVTRDIPFLVIKALSDNLTTQFPKLEFLIGNPFKKDFWKSFFYFLKNPRELFWLWKMYKNMDKAVNANYKSVLAVIQELFAK
ncbi:MAG: hypothetical protein DKM50_07980 [Candidatus Margulisiibacteriota bacterium]|nr:MAG: hypothetical protein A2X43_07380 [Candidatus Margulisbacteria bacterium GWD2_39_127]OGI03955.1 MAG: hypothetical protein A2X42_10355 [Candidatus Margulisbacteria bacterium GWF2_38_17]OGI08225.1 MAG: hypothetical protein A2X41_00770 [Candidatus Margulisbacteria bacterium GWE2_39_32]PZM79697.1 MAG: hypothetical protein DKM50_07980 [Candidatus Margulisiibacteriota bacterium]HAR61910.1 hypothetical protein [Candidatus Margulisiibacteriota bacterium]